MQRQLTSKALIIITILILMLLGGYILLQKPSGTPFRSRNVKGTQTRQSQTAQAKLAVGNTNYTLNFRQGDTLLSALTELKNSNQNFDFDTKQYDFGMMIMSINDITPSASQFWKLQINGTDANQGVSEYIVKPSDRIEFTLEKITF